jgi:hypothetical protein
MRREWARRTVWINKALPKSFKDDSRPKNIDQDLKLVRINEVNKKMIYKKLETYLRTPKVTPAKASDGEREKEKILLGNKQTARHITLSALHLMNIIIIIILWK